MDGESLPSVNITLFGKKVPFFSLQLLQSLLSDCHDKRHISELFSILLSIYRYILYLICLLNISHWALSIYFKVSAFLLWNGSQVLFFLFKVITSCQALSEASKAKANQQIQRQLWVHELRCMSRGNFKVCGNRDGCLLWLLMNFSRENQSW